MTTTWSNLSSWLHCWARKASFNSLEKQPNPQRLASQFYLPVHSASKGVHAHPTEPTAKQLLDCTENGSYSLQTLRSCLLLGFQLPTTSSLHPRGGEEVSRRAEHSPCSSLLLPGLSGKAGDRTAHLLTAYKAKGQLGMSGEEVSVPSQPLLLPGLGKTTLRAELPPSSARTSWRSRVGKGKEGKRPGVWRHHLSVCN